MDRRFRAALRRQVRRAPVAEREAAERSARELLRCGEEFVGHVLALLRDPNADTEARTHAAWLLRVLDEHKAIPTLLRIIADQKAEGPLRTEAIQTMSIFKSKQAIGPLTAILLDEQEDLRTREIATNPLGWVLREVDDQAAKQALMRLVKDPAQPSELRGDAAEALSMFKDARAIPVLMEQLDDPSPEVRFWSVFALGAVADADAIPALERLAETDDAIAPGWWPIKKEARDAVLTIRARLADQAG